MMGSRQDLGVQMLQMIGILLIMILVATRSFIAVASFSGKVDSSNLGVDLGESSNTNMHGCLPCSQKYLTGSYLGKHNSMLDSDFHGFLAQELGLDDFCVEMVHNMSNVPKISLFRYLKGEGSHRRLVSTMRFHIQSDVMSWLDVHFCEAIIIEQLPTGVFADPFELQHLVHRGVFLDAAVFGDTNLELPSALSNRSIVEIHMDIGRRVLLSSSEVVIELPLHARYPPLDASGYARIEIGAPDLFLRCRPKNLQSSACYWTLGNLGYGSANSVMWRIPCGNKAHTGFVSSITFVSALVCALLIVHAAIFFPGNNDVKGSK